MILYPWQTVIRDLFADWMENPTGEEPPPGPAPCVVVEGPAGCGKTALGDVLRNRLGDRVRLLVGAPSGRMVDQLSAMAEVRSRRLCELLILDNCEGDVRPDNDRTRIRHTLQTYPGPVLVNGRNVARTAIYTKGLRRPVIVVRLPSPEPAA